MAADSGVSFPSGHATTAAVLTVALIIIAATFTWHALAFMLGGLCAVAVAASRVYLGDHYPLDVVGGMLCALAVFVVTGPAGIITAGVAGNYLAWAAGGYWDRPQLRRWGRRVRLREHDIDRAAARFDRYGPAAVFFGGLVPVVRTFISLPARFARMPAARFGAYTTAGCIPWTADLAAAGYALGRNWQSVANGFHGATYLIAAVLVIGLAAAVILHLRGRRTRAGAPRRPLPCPPTRRSSSLGSHRGRAATGPRPAVSGRRWGRRSARPSSRCWQPSRQALRRESWMRCAAASALVIAALTVKEGGEPGKAAAAKLLKHGT